jgi:hypothetical protein
MSRARLLAADRWLANLLKPKALPAFIEKEPPILAPSDVALAAFHSSRYIRSEVERTV